MTDTVTLFEVGPRDGLQNEAALIDAAQKIDLVDRLSATGLRQIEVTSFVSPKWVPQLADAAQVMAGITRARGVCYSVLIPNLKGYVSALAARADKVAIFASASEGFSQRNINCSVAESLKRFAPICEAAVEDGVSVRGYISCVTDCPFDGPVSPAAVAKLARALVAMNVAEISLGDTIGAGTPETVAAMLDAVLAEVPAARLAGHFHNTNGRALDNIDVSLDRGLRTFDAAVGGLGGCPYAPGAAGNVASEEVNAHLLVRGFDTGVDPAALADAGHFARSLRREA